MATEPTKTPQNGAGPLLDLGCNLIVPILLLNKGGDWLPFLSAEAVLIFALIFPVGFFAWDFSRTKMVNGFSIVGFISVLLTGGIGLLKLGPMAFAIKETAMPLLFGAGIVGTIFVGKPFFEQMILGKRNRLNLKIDELRAALDSDPRRAQFHGLMKQCTWIFAASFLVSAVLNYVITRMIVTTDPTLGAEAQAAFNAEIGKQTGIGFFVIGLSTLPLMFLAFVKLMKGVKAITGRDLESFMPDPEKKR